jgi:hypothetical protein
MRTAFGFTVALAAMYAAGAEHFPGGVLGPCTAIGRPTSHAGPANRFVFRLRMSIWKAHLGRPNLQMNGEQTMTNKANAINGQAPEIHARQALKIKVGSARLQPDEPSNCPWGFDGGPNCIVLFW